MGGEITTGEFVLAWAVAAVAAALVFVHADRRGSRHATAWGVFVFFFLAVALPVYAIHAWLTRKRSGSDS